MYSSKSKDNEVATVFALIGVLTGVAGLIIVSAILNGFVLSVLWGWFVAEYFGTRTLSIPAAIGISIVVSFLTYRSNLKTEDRSVWVNLALVFVLPLFSLFMG